MGNVCSYCAVKGFQGVSFIMVALTVDPNRLRTDLVQLDLVQAHCGERRPSQSTEEKLIGLQHGTWLVEKI